MTKLTWERYRRDWIKAEALTIAKETDTPKKYARVAAEVSFEDWVGCGGADAEFHWLTKEEE